MKFLKVDKTLFFSKNDRHDPRLGDNVKIFEQGVDLEQSFVILGYPDDDGIKLNGGRVGARLAPSAVRKNLYKLTPALNKNIPSLFDYGDLEVSGTLEERHHFALNTVKKLLSQGASVVSLGGGHDYGFSDFGAFVENSLGLGKRPFIVNFDAHLDVRPDTSGPHSGTPFYRLLSQYSKVMDFFEVGIQDWCNSSQHLAWAKDHGAKIISLHEILQSKKSLRDLLYDRIWSEVKPHHDIALSVDIDGFQSSFCPGASQVFPVGININDFMASWQAIINNFKPRLMGIYEVSPPFDQDDRTAKVSALLIHQFIFSRS